MKIWELKCIITLFILSIGVLDFASAKNVFEGKPYINPPYVTAIYPNTDFLFAIPTSGERPMTWTVSGLPEGLSYNGRDGIIRGKVMESGEYIVHITAQNLKGKDSNTLTIKVGNDLVLTPVMGWNSWNTFGRSINEQLVLEVADAMVSSGMRDLGYNYVCIDDFWQEEKRGEDGRIKVNKEKFPNGLRYVADYLHERGLHLGVYSDASDKTCGGVCGSYGYEESDTKDMASWGVDLLKYDYCGAPSDRATAIKRYTAMSKALKKTNRSVVFSICEWGGREPWLWAKSVGGHYWRTTGDIMDNWTRPEFNGIIDIVALNGRLAKYAGPGGWNDPDMLVVGISGRSKNINYGAESYGCTNDEYRTHMSLWCMMASPLLCGNDIRNMSQETKDILLNPEIIAINQDRLGEQGRIIHRDSQCVIWKKNLSEGIAIAVCNLADSRSTMKLDFDMLGIPVRGLLRDVWSHKNLNPQKILDLDIAPHGCEVFVVK